MVLKLAKSRTADNDRTWNGIKFFWLQDLDLFIASTLIYFVERKK